MAEIVVVTAQQADEFRERGGGVHGAEEGSVNLDDATHLGITVGETYPMDIFHAERHTNESNYRIETTIDLSCIENVEVPVI